MKAAGSIMGSGGMVVLDETACMVDVARYFLDFTLAESCGKCTACREGTRHLREILTRITRGEGTPDDLDLLEEVGEGGAGRLAVRPGPDRAESGAFDLALFPGRVRGARRSNTAARRASARMA